METVDVSNKYKSLRDSDPTYEAWKQAPFFQELFLQWYSDPTYEAWKRYSLYFSIKTNIYSDPTYEAWKLGAGYHE